MKQNPYVVDVMLRREDVPSFDTYPFNLDAVRNLEELSLHPSVTFLVGENGSGKSTLLEAIAVAFGFNAEGGSKNFSFGSFDSHSRLHEYLRLSRGVTRPRDGYFLRAESFFNVATEIERLDAEPGMGPPVIASYGGVSLHKQSHGESFMSLFLNRFGGDGFYVLDEPEAALSPTRQMAMLTRMHDLVQANSQFVIATHSPIIMAYPHAKIYVLDAEGIRESRYEDTEHYRVSQEFMAAPQRMLKYLLADDEPDR